MNKYLSSIRRVLEFIEPALLNAEMAKDPQAIQEWLDLAATTLAYMSTDQWMRYRRLFDLNQQAMLHTANLYPIKGPLQKKCIVQDFYEI